MGPSHAMKTTCVQETKTSAPRFTLLRQPKTISPEDVYRASVPMLKGLARKVGIPACDVEDTVQDAFVRLLGAGEFPSLEAARSYLCSAVRSIAIDRYRRSAFRRTESAGEEISQLERRLWESDADHERSLAALSAVLEGLRGQKGSRDLAWFYRDGMSLKEICAKTREPVGTVSARLARARVKHAEELRAAVEAVRA